MNIHGIYVSYIYASGWYGTVKEVIFCYKMPFCLPRNMPPSDEGALEAALSKFLLALRTPEARALRRNPSCFFVEWGDFLWRVFDSYSPIGMQSVNTKR